MGKRRRPQPRFLAALLPAVQQAFPAALRKVSLDDFHFAVHHVAPSINRVRADEVTYNFHIGIRFELERALIAGELPPADVPAAWNASYRRDLDVVPVDDAEGCLQDGHWAAGLFGYFPTYTIGNLFAAQLMAKAREEIGDLEEPFSHGDFGGLLAWLRRHVHQQGSRLPAPNLIEKVTGAKPHVRPLVDALRTRYGQVYSLT